MVEKVQPTAISARKHGKSENRKHENMEMRKHGNMKTRQHEKIKLINQIITYDYLCNYFMAWQEKFIYSYPLGNTKRPAPLTLSFPWRSWKAVSGSVSSTGACCPFRSFLPRWKGAWRVLPAALKWGKNIAVEQGKIMFRHVLRGGSIRAHSTVCV